MRILWASPAPWCFSGYGVVSANVVPRLAAAGHEVAIFAVYGHKGAPTAWNGIQVYGNEANDWGNALGQHYYKEWNADILLTLFDIWVSPDWTKKGVRWVPYFPVDHQPVPPIVAEHFPRAWELIAMSRYGQKEAERLGHKAAYVPHGVDTRVFFPRPEREDVRQVMQWEGKFVVGTVGTNITGRKNYDAMLQAFAEFHRDKPDSIFYCHTNPRDAKGYPLAEEARALGLGHAVQFPDEAGLINGFEPDLMASVYSGMDAFMLLSKGEGFGLPIIEAQACGVPAVITDFTAMSELAGPGFKVRVDRLEWDFQAAWWAQADIHDAAHALRRLYAEWKRGDHSRNEKAREFALQYDWDTVVKDYWLPILANMEGRLSERLKVETVAFPGDGHKELLPVT